jgi:uncharacterized protein (TIGR02996 family)
MSLRPLPFVPLPRPQVLAFLREIKDRPEDDAPRLLLADWLEEHNDPRGEFVRLQVARSHLPPRDLRRPSLEHREQELLSRYSALWLGPLRTRPVHCRFDRGLIRLAVHATHLFGGLEPEAAPAESFAWVDGVTSIAALTPSTVEAIASSPLFPNLNDFHLNASRLGPQGAARLAELPCLERLTALYLWWGSIGPEGAAALAFSPHLHNLRTLHLSGHKIGVAGAAALANSPYLTRLRTLRLGHNELGAEGVRELAGSPHLSGLTDLHLSENRIGTEGALALAASPHLRGLSVLYLTDDTIGPQGVTALRCRFGHKIHLSSWNRCRPTEPDNPHLWWRTRGSLARL